MIHNEVWTYKHNSLGHFAYCGKEQILFDENEDLVKLIIESHNAYLGHKGEIEVMQKAIVSLHSRIARRDALIRAYQTRLYEVTV